MNTITVKTLAAAGTLAALVACEGEPPKVPTNAAPAPAAQATAEQPAAEPASSATAARPAPSAQPGAATSGPCNCPCMGGGTQGGMMQGGMMQGGMMQGGMHGGMHAAMHGGPTPPSEQSTGGEASPPQGAVVAPVAPGTDVAAPSAAHNVTGTITTTPARAAGAAVVYLEDAPIVPNRGSQAAVDNRGMSFIPFVTVVAAGGRVLFTNGDPFPHNVFSPDNEKFNLGMVQPKGSSARVFKTPGVYSLLCNLHPNMLGYVVVTPSSFFTKANAKGQFTLKDVPAGTYKMTAWAPRQQPVTQSITVKDADVTADFTLHR